jgi:hypothetical protein
MTRNEPKANPAGSVISPPGYHQRHCAQAACRQASKVGSQNRWLALPENRDYFSDAVQRDRVREWRAAHPKYWKKREPTGAVALKDMCYAQSPEDQRDVAWDDRGALKEEWKMQAPLVIGLISHLTGVLEKEEIVEMTGRLLAKGHALIGAPPRSAPLPDDDRKTHFGARPAAAGGCLTTCHATINILSDFFQNLFARGIR